MIVALLSCMLAADPVPWVARMPPPTLQALVWSDLPSGTVDLYIPPRHILVTYVLILVDEQNREMDRVPTVVETDRVTWEARGNQLSHGDLLDLIYDGTIYRYRQDFGGWV